MRILTSTLIVMAMTLFGAASASAYAMALSSNYDGVSTLAINDTVTVEVFFDTEGAHAGIIAFSMGVEFDDTIFDYDIDASSSLTYLLYVNGKSAFITPLGCCVGGTGPKPWGLAPQQVNIDWGSTQLGTGTPAFGTGSGTLATLVFVVTAAGDGNGEIFFNYQSNRGNTFAVGTGVVEVIDQVTLTGTPINVSVPEPAAVGLSLAALLTLGVVASRRRS